LVTQRVSMSMKASLTLIGAALALAACTPSTPTPVSSQSRPSQIPVTAASSAPPPIIALPSLESTSAVALKCAYSSASIPDQVMVRDVFGAGSDATDPCDHDLGVKTSSIVARRAIEVTFDDDPSNAYSEASVYRHTVTVYNSGDAASAYLSSVRAAVRECPNRKLKFATWKYAILSSTATRLELSIRHIYEAAEVGPKEGTFRVSIVRAGAKVSVLADVGWEGLPSYKSAVDALVTAASEQLVHWE
jgi:hypothetical protein